MQDSERLDPIAEVRERLDEILDWSQAQESRAGYFAALYRRATITIREKIHDGDFFENEELVVSLDIAFARRYLDAFDDYTRGTGKDGCWPLAFSVTERFWPIVLQHLLLAMNAHVNIDLAVATAQVAGSPDRLPRLRSDFEKVNQVLASLVGSVQEQLAEVWPLLRVFNTLLGRAETVLINFEIDKARDEAWRTAQELVILEDAERRKAIARLNEDLLPLSRLIYRPGILLKLVTKLVRLGEPRSVPQIIEILKGTCS